MSKYIKMVDCSEDELMHYGVLGMKWMSENAAKQEELLAPKKKKYLKYTTL